MNTKKVVYTIGMVSLLIGVIGLSSVQARPLAVVASSEPNVLPAVLDIGVLAPITGELESLGLGIVDGILAAAYEINNSADFSFNVTLNIQDSKAEETAAITAYETVKADGVELIIGAAGSSASKAVAERAKDDHIAQISYASTGAFLSNASYDYFWRTVPTDALQSQAMANLLNELDYSKVVVVHRGDDYGTGFGDGVNVEFTALGGEVLDQISYAAGTTDFGATVTSVKQQTEADAIVLIAYITDGGNFITDLREGGVDLPVFGTDGIADTALLDPAETTATIENDSELVAGTKPHVFASGEGKFDDFMASLSDIVDLGIASPQSADKKPKIFSDYAYDALFVGALAIEAAGTYDGALINAEIPDVGKGFVGSTGNKTFSAVGDVVEASYDIFQFQSGELKVVGAWSAGAGLVMTDDFIDPKGDSSAPGFEALSTLLAIFGIGVFVVTVRKKRPL